MKIAKTPVADIGYFESGHNNGFPVLFLHGFPDDAHTWDGVVANMEGAPLRLVRPFLRGFGPTRVTNSEARSGQVAALAQDVIDLVDALEIDRFALVGQDWGARAAYATAILAPQRVTWLVTLATSYGSGPDELELRLHQIQAFWYQWWFLTSTGRETLERDRFKVCEYLWRAWSPKWEFHPNDFIKVAPSFENEQFVESVIHYYQHRRGAAQGSPHYQSQETQLSNSPKITVPATFIYGTADACNLPESCRGSESLFSAGLEQIELLNVGHFVQREQPDTVAEVIKQRIKTSI